MNFMNVTWTNETVLGLGYLFIYLFIGVGHPAQTQGFVIKFEGKYNFAQ